MHSNPPGPDEIGTDTFHVWSRNETPAAKNALLDETGVVTTRKSEHQSQVTRIFTNGQPLHDFESFDSASRGPWPSFLLIWKTRASHLVSLGALLTIVNLAFQPFVQQAVSFPQRLVPSGNATVPTIYNITVNGLQGNNVGNLNIVGSVPSATVSAIYAGLNGGANLSEVVPYCATGNCTWDLYDSLAICANPVANLTHLLTRTAIRLFINTTSISFNTQGPNTIPSTAYPGNQTLASIAFPDIPVVLDFFMIYYSPSINNVAAIEASLSFCGQTYNTSVHNGQINTTEIQKWGRLDTSQTFDFPKMWPLRNFTTLWVAKGYSDSLQDALAKIFSGYYEINDNEDETYSSVAVQALNSSLIGSQDDVATLSLFRDEIAVSITNNLRTGTGSVAFEGVMYGVETYVLVVWVWLILPIYIVLLTLIFLLATIQMSHGCRTKTWKSSSLAVLSGLSSETQDQLGGLTSMATVEERSERVRVRMVEDKSGWKLAAE
ncbi:hypothetical protein G7Y89_g9069 [Cudoniella acicularis]|uniref:Uncharacterized protein n=1 Tax=Cudoniella acicularis TaxID=354080 RepID=A0A8H4W0F6_9HELO|nr:hypothetical protein G7Y89_g9069 [Cudoniella acicularis]